MNTNPLDVCELCHTTALPGGRYAAYQHQGLRVCSQCYHLGRPVTCEMVGAVMEALRREIRFYEGTAPQLYGDYVAAKREAYRSAEPRAKRRWPWSGRIRQA